MQGEGLGFLFSPVVFYCLYLRQLKVCMIKVETFAFKIQRPKPDEGPRINTEQMKIFTMGPL